MKLLKSFIAALFICLFILINSETCDAAAMTLPYLPYVPPSSGRVMDYIFNSYGVTALDETDEAKKYELYLNLYRDVLGSAYDNFYIELQEAIQNSKTSRQLILNQSLRDSLRLGIKQSINSGIALEEAETINQLSQLVNWVNQETQFSGLTTALMSNSNIFQYYGENTIYSLFSGGSGNYLYFFACEPKTGGIKLVAENGKTYYRPIKQGGNIYGDLFYLNGNTITRRYMSVGQQSIPSSGAFLNPSNSPAYNVNVGAETVVMSTMNSTVQQKINDESAEVATPVMILYPNGTIDITYPTVIDLPANDVVPATDPEDIAAVQEKLGVAPIADDEDVETIKQSLQAAQTAATGTFKDYSLNLTEYFPFCIPFDIGRIIDMLVADPEAPSFDWVFPSGYDMEGNITYTTLNIDLSVFDSVAAVLRAGFVLLFIIGLGMVTRSLFLRG